MTDSPKFDRQAEKYQRERIAFWDSVAEKRLTHGRGASAYHRRLREIYSFHIPQGLKVIEIGCGEGDLLASVNPKFGLGVDFSPKMIARARLRHPNLNFICADGLQFAGDQTFDVIIISDLVNDVWDVQILFQLVRRLCNPGTRVLINFYSRVWTPILSVMEALGLALKPLEQSWLTSTDIENLLQLSGMERVFGCAEVLFPLPVPGLQQFLNRFLVRFWPFNLFGLTNLLIARPSPTLTCSPGSDLCITSVIIPTRNEAGNIKQIFERVPQMGKDTELIFVEGHSQDDTYAEIEKQITLHPTISAKLLKQNGKGKGDAVRLGFEHARGDVLMILDADLSVPPEYLPRFYEALISRKGEFINGVRLVYPMEKQAMRLLNFLGNKIFSLAFSWLLGQPVKDTLCGTKALFQKDYQRIAENRTYFGDFDPFGDFDLLFGASKLNLRIVDLPVRYRERTYGATNIQRWKHGWLLLRMVVFAAFRMKFK